MNDLLKLANAKQLKRTEFVKKSRDIYCIATHRHPKKLDVNYMISTTLILVDVMFFKAIRNKAKTLEIWKKFR